MGDTERASAGQRDPYETAAGGERHAAGRAEGSPERALLAHVPEMITINDRSRRIVYANPATERISGFAPEELVGRDAVERVHPEDRPRCEEAFERLSGTPGLSLELEHRISHKNGQWRWVEGTFANLFEDPVVGGLLATVRDVTERKRAEGQLRFQARLLGAVGEAVVAVDAEGGVSYWNRAAEDAYGWTAEEALGRQLKEMVVSEGLRGRAKEIMAALRAGRPWSGQFEVLRKDGSAFTAWATNEPLFGDEGDLVGVICVFRDVTGGKRSEEALRENERRFRLMADTVPIAVWITDSQGRTEFFNRWWTHYCGVPYEPTTAAEVAARFLHPEDAPKVVAAFQEARRTGTTMEVEQRNRSASGEYRWFLNRAEPYRDPQSGEIVRWFGVGIDIHDRKLAEEALKESEERHRLIVEGARDYAILTTDTEGMITSWSQGAEVVYGWTAEEVLGRPAAITFTLEDREAGMPEKELAVAHREGSAFDERWHVRKDGSRAFIEGTRVLRGGDGGEARGFLKFGQDVTERRALEEERGRLREVELTARAEAAERERISRELHDRVAHTMAVAHQSLQLHEALAQSDPSRAAEKLERAAEATRTALDQTRDLSAQLARSGMEETRRGLGAALRDLLTAHVPPHVEATLSVSGDESSVPERVGEQAYLVMRKAVRNAVAHSGCGRIEVSLEVEDAELRGRVEDDGTGFDPHGGPRGRRDDGRSAGADEGAVLSRAGVGLLSMRERAEQVDITTEPGRGTAVVVCVLMER